LNADCPAGILEEEDVSLTGGYRDVSASEDCIFCSIVAGNVPAAKLIETDKVISFLDIAPVNRGHCLVVPKRHSESLVNLTQEELHTCIFTVQRIARAAVTATTAEGVNVLQNNGKCAGQVISHVHFHVIPRWSNDGFRFGWRQGSYNEGEIDKLQEEIQALL